MNIKYSSFFLSALFLSMVATIPTPSIASNLALSQTPLFLVTVEPNVVVMLDNSGSMKAKLYSSGFNPANSYYGLFEANMNYVYDDSIPVNAGGYAPMTATTIDTTKTGAFKESNCTPATLDVTCWSGNYLNWLTTRRIDASRKVLMGGKLENSSSSYNYGTNLNYKLVGNNEHGDGQSTFLNRSYASSSQYSPVPDGSGVTMYSPSQGGTVKTQYDPYAKITMSGGESGLIYNSTGTPIGEFGSTEISETLDNSGNITSWTSVSFANTYVTTPVVVAKPMTFNGGHPGVVRIRNVTTSGFEISVQEWRYLFDGGDKAHTDEDVSYVVLKSGTHTLPGGIEIDADTVSTNREYVDGCGTSRTNSTTVTLNTTLSSPVVITSVLTDNEIDTVTSRVTSVNNTSFVLFLQEEEDRGGHAAETVGYIAIEKGTVSDTSNSPNWQLEVGDFSSNVDESTTSHNFSTAFSATPVFVAAMQTRNGADTATLRLNSVNNTTATVFLEEEASCDSELDHVDEEVSYFAFSGASSDLNVALVVEEKPTGLLHDIDAKVRLGVSFYRYDPGVNDIIYQNIDGGTLNFKIPLNPFVKKPTDTNIPIAERGYRDLSGYIGMTVGQAADALENYPLVWGTTPLAENLWEVIRYFEQETPRFSPVGGVDDFVPNKGTVNDPYYFTAHNTKLECAKSSVIIFTDGEPYQDSTVTGFSTLDYDGDNNATDLISNQSDLLDDVAYWGFCDTSKGSSCVGQSDGTRDLRSDLSGDQNIKVYTVAFGGNSIAQVLQDTADNAGGTAYLAEDGLALKSSLEEAFTAAIDDSSASAVSVNTGSLTSDTTVFQARFNSNDWTGEVLAYPVNSDGSLAASQNASYLPVLHSSRIIASYNGSSAGIPFQWASLSATQQTLLNNDASLLNFIRGDDTNEGSTFRTRSKIDHDDDGTKDRIAIGDMIHSSPAFVGVKPKYNYSKWQYVSDPEYNTYNTFQSSIEALNNGTKCVNNSDTAYGRIPVVYVGANDGMLHAFNANSLDCDDDGTIDDSNFAKELFAYVPNKVFTGLAALSQTNYVHQYTVDGSPSVGDAYFANAWHTVLVSGLRGGGQGIFALDVTNPATFDNETNAAANVLWEFTDMDDDNDQTDGNVGEKGDRDLGFTFSRPNIVRMHNGIWAAVFGNGYNNTESDSAISSSGNAVLYIVNLQTGALIKKIDTGVGSDDAASGKSTGDPTGRPNGLSSVSPVDIDGDNIVDYIYGGDLYGNLWKFDVNHSNTANWQIYNGANHDQPLFQTQQVTTVDGFCWDEDNDPLTGVDGNEACSDTYDRQPITTRPQVGYHPIKNGYMVYFGTGKYIESTDNSAISQNTQSFYGIWDRELSTASSIKTDYLLEQEITHEVSAGFDTDDDANTDDELFDLRITSNNTLVWHGSTNLTNPSSGTTHLGWYIDLYSQESGNTDNYGERQVSDPVLRNGRIIFTTLIPSHDPCENGGTGWLMELDADSGGRLAYSPFDLNNDGLFNISDFILIDHDNDPNTGAVKVPSSGKKSKAGIIATPGIVDSGDGSQEFKYNSGSSGEVEVTAENPGPGYNGRQSWKQLEF